jgi:hypothetical protein
VPTKHREKEKNIVDSLCFFLLLDSVMGQDSFENLLSFFCHFIIYKNLGKLVLNLYLVLFQNKDGVDTEQYVLVNAILSFR